ncbi:branched-chain amino acid ABC transporter permease [Microbacterium sp.]|uniref:branched-chain amino acid ABC transporter permease n=1 Tax=Microbacterium sp. TaxID=51671 RepID=UPI003A86B13C
MLDGVVIGVVTGSAYGILAVCLVLVYRMVGVLNLAQAAIGGVGAYACYGIYGQGLPLVIGAVVGVCVSAAVAGGAGWVIARFFGAASPLTRTVATAIILLVLLAVGYRLFGDSPRLMPTIVPDLTFPVAGVRVSLSTLIALAVMLTIAAALTWVLRHTLLGIQLRALATDPLTAMALGVRTHRLALGVWLVSGGLAAIALLLIAPTYNPTFASMSLLVVPALAAALVAGFSSGWVAAGAGLVLGVLEGVGARIPAVAEYRGLVPFLVVVVGLIWLRRREVWDAAG